MALLTRLSRMFRADMHEVLDRLEEPDLLLKQSIREMEDCVAGLSQQLMLQRQEQERLQRRKTDIDQDLRRLESELDLCFQAGNDALVRTLIRRKLETEKHLQNIMQALARLDASKKHDEVLLATQKQQLEGLKLKTTAWLNRSAQTETNPCFVTQDAVITDADIEIALLREQQKRYSYSKNGGQNE